MKSFNLSIFQSFNRNKGFTLIEMLIVIAIIAILSSIFLVGMGSFRGSAQDTRRISDLQKVQSYLELFYMKYRCYPYSGTAIVSSCVPPPSNTILSWADLKSAFKEAGIDIKIPDDPLYDEADGSSAIQYQYAVSADAQSYVLAASLNEGHSSYNEDIDGSGSSVYGLNCGTVDDDTVFCVKI